MQVPLLPQHAIVELTQRLLKGQRHKKKEIGDHRKQSEKSMASKDTCTLAKGNGKLKIIGRA